MSSLRISFYAGAGIFFVAALLSALRGKRYVHEETAESRELFNQENAGSRPIVPSQSSESQNTGTGWT
jgi:hypothetical protein